MMTNDKISGKTGPMVIFDDLYATPAPTDPVLYELAREYERRTEAFDRTVCTGPVIRGSILPATPREQALIGRNARQVLNDLVQAARERGFSRQELLEVIHAG